MAKEMIITFVYDTQLIKNETDDPATAILYFHPTWVSDSQKTALCGQLMGVYHCLKSILKCPKIISLQSGKFFIREYGRYILATGTDRNIVDWLLEHRANILHSLISFYHKGIEDLSHLYPTTDNLSAKLYHIFETYLKVLFLGGNIFTYIPTLRLPKSASNMFLEAIHTLQCCQKHKYVLGGTLLYHNKVVATQLNSDYTKRIVLTDPYRIKSPAEMVSVNFDLPLGVQLLEVFVDGEEYQRLLQEATKSRSILQYSKEKSIIKGTKSSVVKEPVISAMKRDQSLLFTAVLEEDTDQNSSIVEPIVPMRNLNRPKFLNLKNKTTDVTIENKETNKSVVSTPHHGQTSICSTPLTELKKVLHVAPLSICTNSLGATASEKKEDVKEDKRLESIKSQSPNSAENSHTSLHTIDFKIKEAQFLQVKSNIWDLRRYYSMNDLYELQKSKNENNETRIEDNLTINEKYKTIADPLFPIFKSDGKSASYSYYKYTVSEHLKMVTKDLVWLEKNAVENEKNEIDKSPEIVGNLKFNKNAKNIEKRNSSDKGKALPPASQNSNQDRRKSLTLPLKSLSDQASTSSDQVSPVTRRYSVGVQLTPLMSKLSALDFEERSSGFGSRQTTPGEYGGPFTPSQSYSSSMRFKMLEGKSGLHKVKGSEGIRKCIMFVFGQQDTVAIILLQEEACDNQDVFSSLFDLCSEYLGKLEKQLFHCLEAYPNGSMQNETEPYSYLCLDPDWDTIQRGGPWTVTELGALTHLHRDFSKDNNLVEILIRGNENVIYGYHLGDTEVFYHEAAPSNAGLPTPADTMGNLPLKARRRLERDHAVILL